MREKITAQLVKALRPTEKPYEVYDTELHGFVVRVQPTGVVSYCFDYRNDAGKKRRLSFGKHGTITSFQAREAASLAAGKVRLGQDPVAEKKAARQAEAAKASEIAKQRTLREFLEQEYKQWCQTHKKRGAEDLKRLENVFEQFLPLGLSEITQLHLERWRTDRLQAKISKSTIHRDLAELRAALNRAVDWEFLEITPFEKFKMLKFDNARVRFLSQDEEKRLRDALAARDRRIVEARVSGNAWREERGYELLPDLSGHRYGDHLTPMVLLSLNTGLRRGETFALTWASIDFGRRQLTVAANTTKSEKRRHIDLNTEAIDVLRTWHGQTRQQVGLVFPSPHGGLLDNVQKAWSGALEDAKVTGFVWHDLRHTFASKLVMRGVDLNTVRELLGHKDMTMTLRYAHLAPEHRAAAVAKLVG